MPMEMVGMRNDMEKGMDCVQRNLRRLNMYYVHLS